MSSFFSTAARVLFCAIGATVLTSSALADEPPTAPESSVLDSLDQAFGDYIVDPLGAVLFWDTLFWDNLLPLGEGVGTVIGDEIVTDFSERGYHYQLVQTISPSDDLSIVLNTPIPYRMGVIDLLIRTEGGELIGDIQPKVIDPSRLPVEPLGKDMPAIRVINDPAVAPFPVSIDRATGQVLAAQVRLPSDLLPIVSGMEVQRGDQRYTVVTSSRDTLTLKSDALRYSETPLPNPDNRKLPIVVLWLVLGALFFTLRMSFINLRAFPHAIKVVSGAYDDPEEEGEISHFQALSSALSATVGLGNIAGVAIAVSAGGPGAVFWMVVAAFFGMSSKFVECTLGQMYRVVKPDGSVSGGPMHYLDQGLKEMGLGPLGKVLSVTFAVLCVGGSLGGGNMFQANQAYVAVSEQIPIFVEYNWLFGLMMASCVGMVILGGIKRIGAATSVIVPIMCATYVLAGAWILLMNASHLGDAFSTILSGAFSPDAAYGGFIGVLVQGFQRASFSNEAGVGSASIAHSAASTSEPVREGIVALLEPFIDTIIVCTMTGLVVVVTGAYEQDIGNGVVMTSWAFGQVIPWFPMVLTFAVVMFAFSTMVSWSYYGERCITWLFGDRAILPYRILFLFCVFFGSVFKLGNIIGFSDLMILGMAFPNILGAVLLSSKVKAALDLYWAKLSRGEFKRTH